MVLPVLKGLIFFSGIDVAGLMDFQGTLVPGTTPPRASEAFYTPRMTPRTYTTPSSSHSTPVSGETPPTLPRKQNKPRNLPGK